MIEYTSLDISRRLAEAGFKEATEYGYWNLGTTPIGSAISRHNANFGPRDTRLICCAFRADTLMEWLTGRGYWVKVYPKVQADCVVSAGHYPIRFRGRDQVTGHGANTPDALGEVVLAVLAKETEHGKQG